MLVRRTCLFASVVVLPILAAGCKSSSNGGGAATSISSTSSSGGASSSSGGAGGQGGVAGMGGMSSSGGAGGQGTGGAAGAGSTSSLSTSGSGGQGGGTCGGLWSKRFGDAGDQSAAQLGVSGAGMVVIGDAFAGTVDFGGGPLACQAAKCGFVAAFDAAGNFLWNKRYPDAANGQVEALALGVEQGGHVALTGSFSGAVDFGTGPKSCASTCAYVAEIDANGAVLWVQTFAAANGDVLPTSIAIAPSGEVALVGTYTAPVDFGGGLLPVDPQAVPGGAFLTKLDALGAYVSGRAFPNAVYGLGNSGRLTPAHIVYDSSANTILAASLHGAIGVDGQSWYAFGSIWSDVGLFAKFDVSNNLVWSAIFRSRAFTSVGRPGTGPSDVVGATAQSGYDAIWNTPNPNIAPGSNMAAGLMASAGGVKWARYDTTSNGVGEAAAVDGFGNAIFVGELTNSFEFGSGTLTGWGIFVTKLDGAGTPLWSHQFGAYAAYNVAADPSGCIAIVGKFAGKVDFGYGSMVSAGQSDIFLAKLAP